MPKNLRKYIYLVGIALFWALVWQIASMLAGQELLLPSPLSTARALWALMGTRSFWQSAAYTIIRVMGGYALGVMAGAALGIACALSPLLDRLLSPIRSVVKATPVTSFILLVLLWLTTGLTPLFVAFLIVLPVVWANVLEGMRAADPHLLEMARAFHMRRADVIRHIYIPFLEPYFTAACATALGLAWKAGVAAEVIASPALSIGRSIYESKLYLETADLFAWTVVVVALSMTLERLVLWLFRLMKGGRP